MASGNRCRTQLDFPVPRGPKRKKLLSSGGWSNLGNTTPFFTEIWSFQLQIAEAPRVEGPRAQAPPGETSVPSLWSTSPVVGPGIRSISSTGRAFQSRHFT